MSVHSTTGQDLPGQPFAQLVEVTPWLAKQWLGQNINNRPIKKAAIEDYVRDMRAGRWLVSGEAIKFSSDGRMIDGQNRCIAVVKSGATIKSWVIYGLEPEAQDVMDSGVKRTNGDQLGIHGILNAKTVATTASAWTGWYAGRWKDASTSASTPQLTHSESLQFVADHPEVVEAGKIARQVNQVLRIPPGVIGASWMITSRIDAAAADTFYQRLQDMELTGPLSTLVKKVQADRDQGRVAYPGQTFFYLFRTWNAWRDQDPLSILRTKFRRTKNDPEEWIKMPQPH